MNIKLIILLALFSSLISAQDQPENLSLQHLKWFPAGNYSQLIHFNSAEAREQSYFLEFKGEVSEYTSGFGLVDIAEQVNSSEPLSWTAAQFNSIVFDKHKALKRGVIGQGSSSFQNKRINYFYLDSRLAVFQFKHNYNFSENNSSLSKVEEFSGFQIYKGKYKAKVFFAGKVSAKRVKHLVVYLAQGDNKTLLLSTELEILKKSLTAYTGKSKSFCDQIIHKPLLGCLEHCGQLWVHWPSSGHEQAVNAASKKSLLKQPHKTKKNYPEKTLAWNYTSNRVVKIEVQYFPSSQEAVTWAKMQNSPLYNQDLEEWQIRSGKTKGMAFNLGQAGLQPYFSNTKERKRTGK